MSSFWRAVRRALGREVRRSLTGSADRPAAAEVRHRQVMNKLDAIARRR